MNTNWLLFLILLLCCEWTRFINAAKPVAIKPTQHVTVQPKPGGNIQVHQLSKQTEIAKFNKDNAERSNEKTEQPINPLINELNEFKHDAYNYRAWSPYGNMHFPYRFPISTMFENFAPYSHAPPMWPFLGISQPYIVPFPFMMAPDTISNNYADTASLAEDAMSRTASTVRRPTGNMPNFQRNSPIYYVRLPPTPYMFLPGINYHNTPAFAPLLPYSSMPAFHAVPMSSLFDLPINFLANGKPSGIYRIDVNDMQQAQLPFAASRPGFLTNPYRPQHSGLTAPSTANVDVTNAEYSFPTVSPSATSSLPESKLTTLKRPYMFNGRPEDIFILPNNFNTPIFSDTNFY